MGLASSEQYFALIVPLGMIMLGCTLIGCWRVLRQQQHLPWLAGGYILPALALGAQTLMTNAQLAQWALLTGSFYLLGFWSLARGMAMRYGEDINSRLALLIGAVTLGLLYYWSRVDEVLWLRIIVLTSGLGLMYVLPIRSVFRAGISRDLLERVLQLSYAISALYAVARPLVVIVVMPAQEIEAITRSSYWMWMLAVALLFSLWFMLVLLACTMRDVLRALRDERNRDSLTQLLNRRAFFEQAQLRLADPRLAPWALLVCDIDHFKRVNDTWGHAAGDEVLRRISQVFLDQVRGEDLAARFGGEEFVVLLSRADLRQAQAIAQRIRGAVSEHGFDGGPQSVSASFGVSRVASGADLSEALRRADDALYQAKHDGRDRVCVAP